MDRNFLNGNAFGMKRKPITYHMDWTRCVSFSICLKAGSGNGYEEEALTK